MKHLMTFLIGLGCAIIFMALATSAALAMWKFLDFIDWICGGNFVRSIIAILFLFSVAIAAGFTIVQWKDDKVKNDKQDL